MVACLLFMEPTQLPPEIQEALQRRQGQQGQPAQGIPPGAPQQPPVTPPMPAQGTPTLPPAAMAPADMGAPTAQMPFDPSEIKMIEGALINRLKSLTEAQFPKPQEAPVLGGQ